VKVVPFTVLVDTAETAPYTFQGLRGRYKDKYQPLHVETKWQCLGRVPDSLGDYSIEGMVGRVHVERKSLEDVQSTVLGWTTKYERDEGLPGRRDKFKKELENLEKIEAPLVVIEATLEECLETMPQWGKKTSKLNAEGFNQSILAFLQDYKVNLLFAGSRRLAEVCTFRFLERFWNKHK